MVVFLCSALVGVWAMMLRLLFCGWVSGLVRRFTDSFACWYGRCWQDVEVDYLVDLGSSLGCFVGFCYLLN